MGINILWAGVVLAMFGVITWRGEKLLRSYLAAYTRMQAAAAGTKEVELMERRTAAEIAAGTKSAAITLRNAELAKAEAEAMQGKALVDELRDDHLAAQRTILASRVAAEENLAEEIVQADHEAGRMGPTLVEQYDTYLGHCRGSGYSHVSNVPGGLRRTPAERSLTTVLPRGPRVPRGPLFYKLWCVFVGYCPVNLDVAFICIIAWGNALVGGSFCLQRPVHWRVRDARGRLANQRAV